MESCTPGPPKPTVSSPPSPVVSARKRECLSVCQPPASLLVAERPQDRFVGQRCEGPVLVLGGDPDIVSGEYDDVGTAASCRVREGPQLQGARGGRDRGQNGSKIHLLTDRNGLPLSLGILGAHMHDSLGLKLLVRGIPPVRSRRGPCRRRPAKLHADKDTVLVGRMPTSEPPL